YPSYLSSPQGCGLDPATANNLVSIGSIGGIVGSVVIGWVINHFKPSKRGILMMIVGIISIVVFALCFSVPVGIMAAFIFFYAAVSQFSMPIAFAWIPDVLKDQKTLSMATGVLMIGANIGGALGITLPSMAIDAAGGAWAAALPVVVGLAIVGLVCALALHVFVQKKVVPVRSDLQDK
ncbi:MFS transporter, partial [uncultured Gemmiger sp.]|uniref:MFS transporter n=1 Tax=uncultured Gemmiger sp. TaxID=1623490 RepID=UPI0025CBC482